MMTGLQEYLTPYLIAQAASLFFLVAAWKNTRVARVFFALLFVWASATNMYLGFNKPDIYLDYATTALPVYRDFINGWFSHYNHIIIPLIAAGQLLIGTGMLLKNQWVKWACIGAILFLLSIAPLLVGAGFPFSITVSIAALMILRKDDRRPIISFTGRDNNKEVERIIPKKLFLIKLVHTLIWIFFNIVLAYLFYAIITDQIGIGVWLGLGCFLLEAIVLLIFKFSCPLTVIARKYSNSPKHNFDIFLPDWLARYNKIIYTSLLLVVILLLVYRLL